jgi:hypothetical protein
MFVRVIHENEGQGNGPHSADLNSSQHTCSKLEFGYQLLLVIAATPVKYISYLTICFFR